MTHPIPTAIVIHKKSRTLEVTFDNGVAIIFPAAYLRFHSKSAEMRYEAHDPKDFAEVTLLTVEPVGQYAIKPIFSDGHRTGIFSWQELYELSLKYKKECA